MIAARTFPAECFSSAPAKAAPETEPQPKSPPGETTPLDSFAQVIRQTMGDENPSEGTASPLPRNTKQSGSQREKDARQQTGDCLAAQVALTGLPIPVVPAPSPQPQAEASQATPSTETAAAAPPAAVLAGIGLADLMEHLSSSQANALTSLFKSDLAAAAGSGRPAEAGGAVHRHLAEGGLGRSGRASTDDAPKLGLLAGVHPGTAGDQPLPEATPGVVVPAPLTNTNAISSADTGAALPETGNQIGSRLSSADRQQDPKNPVVPVARSGGDVSSGDDPDHPSKPGGVTHASLPSRAESDLPDSFLDIGPGPDVPADPHRSTAATQGGLDASQDRVDIAPVPVSGTGSAKQVAGMKMQDKTEKSSQNAAKVLPLGNNVPDASPRDAVEAVPRVTDSPDRSTGNRETAPDASQITGLADATPLKSVPVQSRLLIVPVREPQVEKVFNDITDQVVSFKRIGAESVDVKLQPDRGTEITLRLSLNDGHVEVAARLQRGSFSPLDAHWSDLQQTLAQQGVRLGQLEHAVFSQNHGQNSNPSGSSEMAQQEADGQNPGQFERAPEDLDERSVVGALAEPSRGRDHLTKTSTRQTWEMWA